MRILIAPDKFKGSLDATEVASALSAGLRSCDVTDLRRADIVEVPVADGGEGTVDAAVGAGFDRRTLTVSGPVGRPVECSYAVRRSTAVVELAQASGLDALPRDPQGHPCWAPLRSTSHGTGELIADALSHGVDEIILGVGGSACIDGGSGLLTALGARFMDEDGVPVAQGGAGLLDLARVDLTAMHPRLAQVRFVLASDVDNVLLGSHGAAAVFGPQKGADHGQVALLERALTLLRDRLMDVLGTDAGITAEAAGAGAAGGVGYAALAVLDAQRRPGIDVVLDLVQLRDQLRGADLVITGEGSLDSQSLGGKTPLGVLRAAQESSVPVVAVCGRSLLTARQAAETGFLEIHALSDLEPDPRVSMRDASRLLHRIGAIIGRSLPSG